MVKPIIAAAIVAAVTSSSIAAAESLASHQEESHPHRRQLWGGWSSSSNDSWSSSSGKSGKSGGSSSSSSWSSSSGKSGKSGGSSSSWSSSSSSSSSNSSWSSSSSKSGKSKHEVWHGGWGKPGWWGTSSSSGKSGKSGSSSSSSGWSSSGKSGKSGSSSSSSGWSSSGKSGKSGSSSSWSSSGKSGKSGSSSSGWSSSGKSGKSGSSSSSSWSSSGKSGKGSSSSSSWSSSSSGKSGKGSKSKSGKGSKSKSSKGGSSWSDSSKDSWSSSSSSWTSSSGKSGKSGSSSSGEGWYGTNDDWSGDNSHNDKPSKPEDDDWAGGYTPPQPVSAPTHPTGWKDDGWDADEYYKADIEGVRQECNALIEASERELLPKIVRMVFHDCVGDSCDGCINMDNVDNRGLVEPIEGIYPLVQKYSSKLSRADVWAICAIEAASMAVPGGGHHFPLHYIGRKNCADGDEKGYGGTDHAMCSNDLTNHEMLEFFKTNFGMYSPREVVAVMGFHSASTANRDNSGFGNIGLEDGWVENAAEYVLSNKYYQTMKNFVWELQRVDNVNPVPNRHQWYFDPLDNGPIMTNSDMSLLFDFEGYMQADKDGVEGLVMCLTHPDAEFEIEGVEDQDIPLCPMAASTKEFVDMYAEDNDLFIKDFGPAMNKILNWGYHSYD